MEEVKEDETKMEDPTSPIWSFIIFTSTVISLGSVPPRKMREPT